MSDIFHLVYGSKATIEVSKQTIDDILAVARKNNSANEITGLLLYRLGYFIQLLEGNEEQVYKVFSQIKKDTRHHEPKVLAEFESQHRLFEQWSMGRIEDEIENEKVTKRLEILLKTPLGFQDDMKSQVIDIFRQVNQKAR